MPGVDLVLRAGVDSFREMLVVKTPQAASNPALNRIASRTSTQGLTLRQAGDGVVAAVDAAGTAVFTSDGAAMWDSPPGDSSPIPGRPVPGENVEPRRVERLPVQLSAEELAVEPSREMLSDAQTVFPVFVDPSFNGGNEIWSHVSRKSPTASYWSASNRDAIRVGQRWDGTSDDDWRAFVQFGTNVLNGATIIRASFLIILDHTADCAPTPVGLWHARGPMSTSSALTWNNTASDWLRGAPLQTVNASANERSCPKDDDPVEFGNANVKDLMQDTANGRYDTVAFGLRTPDEGNRYQWKRFRPGSAFMDVTYNHPPGAPTSQAIDSCYSACPSPAVVRSGTPTLTARASDPNAGTLRLEYEVYDNARTSLKARSGTAVTGVPSGTARPWRVVPLSGSSLPDGTYHWRVRACDSFTCGGYSAGWFTFSVDTQNPSLPSVSGSPYVETSSGTWNGGPGVAGSFTIGPNGGSGVTQYIYSLNHGAATTVAAGAPQAELLTANQQQVSTGLTGFNAVNSTLTRVTNRGHASGESMQIAPAAAQATACGTGCTFAAVGGDSGGGMRLGMQAGRRYVFTGWIYVPAATGLSPTSPTLGLRAALYYRVGTTYHSLWSPKATVVDSWQQLSVQAQLPAGTTEAFVRLFNGFAVGQTSRVVLWDDLSVRELVGNTTVASITPTLDGTNTLSAQSVDGAGNLSDPRIYQFLVRPAGDLSWYWSLDQNTGNSAASAPANNRPAAFSSSGASWLSPGRLGAARISMTGAGELSTASPVLDTIHPAGFTVAAWVQLADLSAARTAVAQDGTNTSMFRLGYRNDVDVNGDARVDQAWCFTIKAADSASAGSAAACTTDYVVAGDWVHLVGVYDKPNNKIKLYVNGTPEINGSYAEAAGTAAWLATGSFAVGRARNSAPADRWLGDLDEVCAEQEVWTESEIRDRVIQ